MVHIVFITEIAVFNSLNGVQKTYLLLNSMLLFCGHKSAACGTVDSANAIK